MTTLSAPSSRLVVGVSAEPCRRDTGLLPWVASQTMLSPHPVVAFHAWLEYQAGFTEDSWSDEALLRETSRSPALAATAILDDLGVPSSFETMCVNATEGLLGFIHSEDVLVLGSRPGRTFQHLLSQNVVARVLRNAPCVVAIIPQNWKRTSSTQVTIGYNDTPAADAAFSWAVRQAALLGGSVTVVRAVVDGPLTDVDTEARTSLADRLTSLARQGGVSSVSVIDVSSSPGIARGLLRAARESAILVIGNDHAGWLSQATDAGACEAVLLKATLPVIVVPAPLPAARPPRHQRPIHRNTPRPIGDLAG